MILTHLHLILEVGMVGRQWRADVRLFEGRPSTMPTEYPCMQHGRVVLSTGQRKHLNLLISDRSVENTKTYGWDYPPTGFSLRSSKEVSRGYRPRTRETR